MKSRLLPPSLLLGLALAGCSVPINPAESDAVRHFTLSTPSAPATGVRVAAVRLAGHLEPRNLAVRVGADEVAYLEDARWAELPAEGMASRLRAALAGVPAEGTLRVEVSRCEPVRSAGNTVDFQASYTFVPAAGGPAITGRFAATPRPWDGRDAAALVGLYRQALDEFGAAIAAALGKN